MISNFKEKQTKQENSSIFTPPKDTVAMSTLLIPVRQSNRLSTPQQSNIAELSQVQYQLQMDHQNSSKNFQQTLSQIARNGDEILIKLNISTLNQNHRNNLEITAKGYAQVKTEQQQLSPNLPAILTSSCTIPRQPIGPPIQPIFHLSNMAILDKTDLGSKHSFVNSSKCDYLCQSSLNQPDFRGRPSPGITINPYFTSSMNHSHNKNSQID